MLTPQNNILTLFEAQVRTTPTAVALLWGELRYTYAEVNARANQVARVLQAHGVTRETLVGICMPRSAEAVFAILGAIKAGGAYVPIDPDYPVQRQIYMIEDAGLRVLLTDTLSTTAALPARLMIQLLAMDDACLPQQPTTNLNVPVAETSLLYVHYTSGSTGRPKDVCGTHQQLRHRLQWLWQAYPMTEHEACCHKTTLQFVDASLEIFGTLLAGRPLVIVSTEQASNPEVLLQVLAERQVTRLFLVVSHLRTLLLAQPALSHSLPALKLWVVSGEALTRALVERFQMAAPRAHLINLYGCTEVPEISWLNLPRAGDLIDEVVSIGDPLPETQVYLVDENDSLVERGEIGELLVSSPLMSHGYLNDAAENQARFILNPFAPDEATNRRYLYRTRDLAHWLPHGLLQYVGRVDHQVKIRGYRISLLEIEQALMQADFGVSTCLVLVQENATFPENKQLIAFVTPETIDPASLRAKLRTYLPDYMLPTRILVLAQLPSTPSGKIDRQALLAHLECSNSLAPPSETQIEARIMQIWQSVLQFEQISLDDNFFEIGGDSLRLAQVYEALVKEFGFRAPKLTTLLQIPTIRAIAQYLTQPDTVLPTPVQKAKRDNLISQHRAARRSARK